MWLPCINSSIISLYQIKLSVEEVAIKTNSKEIKIISRKMSNDISQQQNMLSDNTIIVSFPNGINKMQKINACLKMIIKQLPIKCLKLNTIINSTTEENEGCDMLDCLLMIKKVMDNISAVRKRHCTRIIVCHFKIVQKTSKSNIMP